MSRPFKLRWAHALLDHAGKPYGCVAMAFKLLVETDGGGFGQALVSDANFHAACGFSERSCRDFKAWLIGHGFLRVEHRGNRGGGTLYQLAIPGEEIAAFP